MTSDMPEYRLPQEWAAAEGIEIYDPDGWRSPREGDPKPFNVPITKDEFQRRSVQSTTGPPRKPGGPALTLRETALLTAVRAAVTTRKARDEALQTSSDEDGFQRLAMEFRRLEAAAMAECEKAIHNG